MLRPSGGFKKLFSPERMAKMKRTPAPTTKPEAPPAMAGRKMGRERAGGVLGRAVGRRAY